MPQGSAPLTRRNNAGGATYLPEIGQVDGRTAPARAFKMAVADIVADLGGTAVISRAQLELARRAAGMSVLAGQIEVNLIAGDAIDVDQYVTITNALGRTLSRLGLKRELRDVTPDLYDYLGKNP
ncbi:MAG: hypothetical protein HOL07_00885 [Rhodospirillaceae bacterium]|jgi:hypothetical protein|nr:hypothetical protein [Rhodospirillaceae bacterium]MBT5356876.1 hypothetical protein [Rhodospirillaceae bacterium]MBT6311356.1 hypothetical protein [Rhodospirillaceae bacterium]